MPSIKLTTLGFVWFLIVLAEWRPTFSIPVSCEDRCTCGWGAERSIVCAGLNLAAVPDATDLRPHSFNLSANNLQEIKDDDFRLLTELQFLDLSYNQLSRISAGAFNRCARLQSLWLAHNSLSSEDVLHVGTNTLQQLYLSANRIDNVTAFLEFSSLHVLDLSENNLTHLPQTFLASLPNLQMLSIAANQISEFLMNGTSEASLKQLNISSNRVTSFRVSGQLASLQVLDLSWNRLNAIERDWFLGLPGLTTFIITGNPINLVSDFAFQFASNLGMLTMNYMPDLTYISAHAFYGLQNLKSLNMAHNSRLSSINGLSFNSVSMLEYLDLSENNISSLDSSLLSGLTMLSVVDLSGNAWSCDCSLLEEINKLDQLIRNQSGILRMSPECSGGLEIEGNSMENLTLYDLDCQTARILSHAMSLRHRVGSSAVLDCVVGGHPKPEITWITNRNVSVWYTDDSDSFRTTTERLLAESSYVHHYEEDQHIYVLENGSLYIKYVTRRDGGVYQCIATNEYGSDMAEVEFHLDYEIMSTVTLMSIIFGFLTAAGFFFVAVIIGLIRYLSFACSKKEKKKRKSIREVLDAIQGYKTAQFDKLSAYKTAKMDQLSAYKSAKIDQLSAFRHARIDKLRTYKQATVTSVLQYLERMREHYANQTARIKDNCTQQMDRVRDKYGVQRGKFKDYRSHQVERMRDNYNAQVMKIREYSNQQMARLREQYKAQQQSVLKLLELIDIGNCVTVIEEECMHTESIIFDASITFDFEAHAIHLPRDTDSNASDESQYLTASESDSDSTFPLPLSCIVDVEPNMYTDLEQVDIIEEDANEEDFQESIQREDFQESIQHSAVYPSKLPDSSLERETKC